MQTRLLSLLSTFAVGTQKGERLVLLGNGCTTRLVCALCACMCDATCLSFMCCVGCTVTGGRVLSRESTCVLESVCGQSKCMINCTVSKIGAPCHDNLSWFVALVIQRVFRSTDDRIVQSRERVLMVGGDVTRRAIKSNPRICLKPGAGLPILLDLRVWLALHALSPTSLI